MCSQDAQNTSNTRDALRNVYNIIVRAYTREEKRERNGGETKNGCRVRDRRYKIYTTRGIYYFVNRCRGPVLIELKKKKKNKKFFRYGGKEKKKRRRRTNRVRNTELK